MSHTGGIKVGDLLTIVMHMHTGRMNRTWSIGTTVNSLFQSLMIQHRRWNPDVDHHWLLSKNETLSQHPGL